MKGALERCSDTVISHLPIIHCQHDAHISNPARTISQQYSKNLSHAIQIDESSAYSTSHGIT
jgi:hypothetical protein